MTDREQNKIQQKIKKLMKQKKVQKNSQILKKPSSQHNVQSFFKNDQEFISQNNQQQISNRTQWNKRSRNSSEKDSQNNYSIATAQTTKTVQVAKFIKSIFQHSKKLGQFLSESQIQKEQALSIVLGNELIMLSLTNKINKLQNNSIMETTKQQLNKIIESELLLKIKKMSQRNRQIVNCQNIQLKLKKLIEFRLQALKKY